MNTTELIEIGKKKMTACDEYGSDGDVIGEIFRDVDTYTLNYKTLHEDSHLTIANIANFDNATFSANVTMLFYKNVPVAVIKYVVVDDYIQHPSVYVIDESAYKKAYEYLVMLNIETDIHNILTEKDMKDIMFINGYDMNKYI